MLKEKRIPFGLPSQHFTLSCSLSLSLSLFLSFFREERESERAERGRILNGRTTVFRGTMSQLLLRTSSHTMLSSSLMYSILLSIP